MSISTVRGVRMPLFTVSALLFVALFWFFRSSDPVPSEPIGQWQWLTQQWLTPVSEQKLTVARLEKLGGALWLEAAPASLRLLYRVEFLHDGLSWRMQAAVPASVEALKNLADQLELSRGERQLNVEQSSAFLDKTVEQLWMASEPALTAEQWLSSAGEPRLKLQMPEGQAWVYPPLGLTAHFQDDQLRLIHQVSARAMNAPNR